MALARGRGDPRHRCHRAHRRGGSPPALGLLPSELHAITNTQEANPLPKARVENRALPLTGAVDWGNPVGVVGAERLHGSGHALRTGTNGVEAPDDSVNPPISRESYGALEGIQQAGVAAAAYQGEAALRVERNQGEIIRNGIGQNAGGDACGDAW